MDKAGVQRSQAVGREGGRWRDDVNEGDISGRALFFEDIGDSASAVKSNEIREIHAALSDLKRFQQSQSRSHNGRAKADGNRPCTWESMEALRSLSQKERQECQNSKERHRDVKHGGYCSNLMRMSPAAPRPAAVCIPTKPKPYRSPFVEHRFRQECMSTSAVDLRSL